MLIPWCFRRVEVVNPRNNMTSIIDYMYRMLNKTFIMNFWFEIMYFDVFDTNKCFKKKTVTKSGPSITELGKSNNQIGGHRWEITDPDNLCLSFLLTSLEQKIMDGSEKIHFSFNRDNFSSENKPHLRNILSHNFRSEGSCLVKLCYVLANPWPWG